MDSQGSLAYGNRFKAITVTGIFLLATSSFIPVKANDNLCVTKMTCSSCIQTKGCIWCSKPENSSEDFYMTMERCQQDLEMMEDVQEDGMLENDKILKSNVLESGTWCPSEYIVKLNSNFTLVKDEPLNMDFRENETEAVLIKPQKMKLKLRVGESFPLELQLARTYDNPIDIYFLMDAMDTTMREDFPDFWDSILQKLKEKSSNIYIGFGTFTDKDLLPFSINSLGMTHRVDGKIKTETSSSLAKYGFKNHMPLSGNIRKFKEEIRKPTLSTSADKLTGGLDALMQVIVCREKIGWRPKAHHLIIMITGSQFHIAGDGKLAGIAEPNDGMCHLTKNMEYTNGNIMDYPSIFHVNKKAQENNMKVIILKTKSEEENFSELIAKIKGSSLISLENNAANIANLINDQHSHLAGSVILGDNSPSHIDVQYNSSYLNDGLESGIKKFGKIKAGDVVNFTAYITALNCPADREKHHIQFQIKPQLINESIEVDLEIICECPCDFPQNTVFMNNSNICSGAGILQCGVCICDKDRIGKQCQCKRNIITGINDDDSKGCKRGNPDDLNTPICSNQGICNCGVCECKERRNPEEKITGKYCECNNFSCKRDDGKICSGAEHGTCVCGKCICQKGWVGESCECRQMNDTCIKPGETSEDAKVCSGRGSCICGKCYCDSNEKFRYSGKYCADCLTCKSQCQELRHCVQCQAFRDYDLMSERECIKCKFTPKIVKSLSDGSAKYMKGDVAEARHTEWNYGWNYDDQSEDEVICAIPDNAGCTFFFSYQYDKNQELIVKVQRDKLCTPLAPILGIVFGVLCSIFFAGMILLVLWKVSTAIHDQTEYAKFEKEIQTATWAKGENPLYRQAVTGYRNPAYSGSMMRQ